MENTGNTNSNHQGKVNSSSSAAYVSPKAGKKLDFGGSGGGATGANKFSVKKASMPASAANWPSMAPVNDALSSQASNSNLASSSTISSSNYILMQANGKTARNSLQTSHQQQQQQQQQQFNHTEYYSSHNQSSHNQCHNRHDG